MSRRAPKGSFEWLLWNDPYWSAMYDGMVAENQEFLESCEFYQDENVLVPREMEFRRGRVNGVN